MRGEVGPSAHIFTMRTVANWTAYSLSSDFYLKYSARSMLTWFLKIYPTKPKTSASHAWPYDSPGFFLQCKQSTEPSVWHPVNPQEALGVVIIMVYYHHWPLSTSSRRAEAEARLQQLEDQWLRKAVLNIHWKDWCWSWNPNTLATWCKELTHWKRPWCWERLGVGNGQGSLACCSPWGRKESDTTEQLNWTERQWQLEAKEQ